MSLASKVALVTGASRGLGESIARVLAQAGCRLALVARDHNALEQLGAELSKEYGVEVKCFEADLADSNAVTDCCRQIEQAFGGVDILVNNAGMGFYKPFIEHSSDEIAAIVDVNVKAAILLCHGVLPGMLTRQNGQIVNIASDLSHRPLANMATYVASKYALRGFSLSLLREVKDRGVRVSLLNPGMIDTYFNGATPSGEPSHGVLSPQSVAAAVLNLLQQPQGVVLDELTLHPTLQDF